MYAIMTGSSTSMFRFTVNVSLNKNLSFYGEKLLAKKNKKNKNIPFEILNFVILSVKMNKNGRNIIVFFQNV